MLIDAICFRTPLKRAMIDAEKQRDRHLDQMTRNAKAFVLDRLSNDPGRGSRPD